MPKKDETILTEEELMAQEEKKEKAKIFWCRLSAYIVTGLLAPCGFIIWRFDLFTKTNQIAMGGWGVILILIFGIFISSTLKWIYKGMQFSIWKQIITGFCRVILPLLCLFLIVYSIRDSIDLLLQALGCILGCESIAVVVNPLPQLYFDKKGEEIGGLMDVAIDKYFTRKKQEEGK